MYDQILGWVSLAVFVVTVLVGVKKKINLGILAIAVTFIFGFFVSVAGSSISSAASKAEPILSLFPFKIFWMTLSVSLMLNIGTENKTFDYIISRIVGLTRGRRALIPFMLFAVMFVICSAGAGSSGTVVLLCTIAATIAKDQEIDPVFMLLSVLSGSSVSIGSPVAIVGIICNSYSEELWGRSIAPSYMFKYAALMSLLTFAVIYIIFKGWKLEKRAVASSVERQKLTKEQKVTLWGYLLFIVLALVCGFDMGLCAFLVTALLLFAKCADEKKIISMVPWSSLLMISGMCMLIGVVQLAGGIQLLTDVLSKLMNKYTVKPLYSIIGSLLSMCSSITGVVLPTMIPTMPSIAAATGVNPFSMVTALAFGANIVCVSPISSMGAIALGVMSTNPEWDTNELFKKMLLFTFVLMGIAALLAAVGAAG